MSAYQYGSSVVGDLREENRVLRARLARTEQTLAGIRARAKPPRLDDYPKTTAADLARELATARRLFPEPAEVKEARLAALGRRTLAA